MPFSVKVVSVREIIPWREKFRQEMACQIIHDSLHTRAGWTQSFLLQSDSAIAGYGAVAVAGPWKGTKTVFEFQLAPEYRARADEFFAILVATAGITDFEVQTNDLLLTAIQQRWCPDATWEKIVFHDMTTTALPAQGAILGASPRMTRPGYFPILPNRWGTGCWR